MKIDLETELICEAPVVGFVGDLHLDSSTPELS